MILKHRRVGSKLLEEATFNFQSYRRHFGPLDSTLVARQYCNDTFPNCNNTFAIIGGSQSAQDYTQDRYSLRNDLTYSGLQAAGQHVIKVGANVDFLRYSTFKENNFNPLYQYFASDSFAFPRTASMGAGNPDFSANNTEIGAYVQDDWSPATRLTLNLGIRWDYESNMLDNDYVTPDSVKMSLDTVVPAKYFTDGTQRPAFLGAFQPRIGFSYALDAQGKTTLFGGFGVYYDRDLYDDVAIIEKYALQHPNYNFKFFANPADSVAGSVRWSNTYLTRQGLVGLLNSGKTGRPEVDLVANDTRQPKSNQWSLGVRRLIGDFVTSVTYTGVRSYNGFTYMCHNAYRDPLPSQPTGCFSVADTAHFGNIFISDDISRTWYNAVYVKVDKPYTPQGRWGAGIAYTLSWAKRDGGGQFDPAGGDVGLFSFDYRFPSDYPHYYAHFDQRHAIVGNWIWVVPGAVQFSGVVNLATATPFTIFTTPVQWNAGRLIASGLFPYRTVDIRLRRDFSNARRSMGVVLDVFNLFNYQNGGADAYGFPAVNYGSPQYLKSDARHVQIGTEVNF